MPKVILPTGDLLRNYRALEPMFSFYSPGAGEEGGLRGLVRDMVLTADEATGPPPHFQAVFKKAIQDSGVLEKVMRDYADSPEGRFVFHTGRGHESSQVEMTAEALYEAVLEMMSAIFMRAVYEISKQDWQWLGDDLVATVKLLDHGNGA